MRLILFVSVYNSAYDASPVVTAGLQQYPRENGWCHGRQSSILSGGIWLWEMSLAATLTIRLRRIWESSRVSQTGKLQPHHARAHIVSRKQSSNRLLAYILSCSVDHGHSLRFVGFGAFQWKLGILLGWMWMADAMVTSLTNTDR